MPAPTSITLQPDHDGSSDALKAIKTTTVTSAPIHEGTNSTTSTSCSSDISPFPDFRRDSTTSLEDRTTEKNGQLDLICMSLEKVLKRLKTDVSEFETVHDWLTSMSLCENNHELDDDCANCSVERSIQNLDMSATSLILAQCSIHQNLQQLKQKMLIDRKSKGPPAYRAMVRDTSKKHNLENQTATALTSSDFSDEAGLEALHA